MENLEKESTRKLPDLTKEFSTVSGYMDIKEKSGIVL
jgi:hypothetical protein